MKKLLRYAISSFGYSLSRRMHCLELQDLRHISITSKTFYGSILGNNSNNILFNVPTDHVSVLHSNSFSLAQPYKNPWSKACLAYLKTSNFEDSYQVLKQYYSSWIPTTSGEYYGLDELETESLLASSKPFEIPLPWVHADIKSYGKKHKQNLISELKSHGINKNEYMGWGACGPLHNEKILMETKRLINTLKSINKNGYQRNDNAEGDIEAFCLIYSVNNPPRFLINVGGHRASCLSALKIDEIPIRIRMNSRNIISRNNSNSWPQVLNKTYTQRQALQVFDRIFSFTQSKYSKVF